ncbi:MAG: hypothetical protein WC728_09990 [Elusimicrobiota bacterium]
MRTLLLLLSVLALAAEEPPLPPSGIKSGSGRAVHDSPDGLFRWTEGENLVSVFRSGRDAAPQKIRLPPGPDPGGRRRLLFSLRAPFFGVLDEFLSEVGLHIDARQAPSPAKATVIRSSLKLLDKDGRILWGRRLPDKHAVGSPSGASGLRVAQNGTVAILLQDTDPYATARPLLLVIDRKGTDKLRLDYTSFRRIEELALSSDGAFLAVRGYGLIPERETWSDALAIYRLGTRKSSVRALPRSSEEHHLRLVGPDGWACCVKQGESFSSFRPDGSTEHLTREKMLERLQEP